jgi:hypothetical protein
VQCQSFFYLKLIIIRKFVLPNPNSGPYYLLHMKLFVRAEMLRLCLLMTALASLSGCGEDYPTEPTTTQPVVVKNISVNPSSFQFSPADGIKDSIITISITGSLSRQGIEPESALLNIELIRASDNSSVSFISTPLNTSGSFSKAITFPTKTTDFNDYRLSLFITSGTLLISNTALATIKIRGFVLGVPEILSTSTPDTVRIPTTGTTPFGLQAKVTHPDGQSLIDRVLVDIRDQQNNLLAGSPFRLYDDGGIGNSNSGDPIPADSIYTRVFNIGSSNNPDVYKLYYYAIDTQGASSDTVQAQMVIAVP